MAFEVLLVFLAMLLATETEPQRSKHLSTRGRLCLCADGVVRLPSPRESEASSFVSCEEKCTTENNAGVLSNGSRRHPRTRRDVLTEAKKCRTNNIDTSWYVKMKAVDFHESGSGSECYAQVSWSPFTGSTQPWIGYYILYFIQGESDKDLISCRLLPKNQTSVNITTSENTCTRSINLNVAALPLSWNSSDTAAPNMILAQHFPTVKIQPGVTPPTFTYITTPKNQKTVSYVSIAIGILVGIALAAGLLRYFLCRKKSSYPPPEYKFYVFIIFNKEDTYWVKGKLLPFLEVKHHFKCCIHYRDFMPGTNFMDSMADSVYNSYKIIAVLSSNF
ncbi:hypothetical protein OS493_031491 [Desmophyllum pertusum]|uniref:TIR domain-containing protein n=1 Tax=Desmophyllum pertusum TaxID=174260 RepID=A0A9W9ZMX6_9CNID|nr:hypothetical protein OS493_031491 [Desmophyllum pertusum]